MAPGIWALFGSRQLPALSCVTTTQPLPNKEIDDHTPAAAGVWSLVDNQPNNEGPNGTMSDKENHGNMMNTTTAMTTTNATTTANVTNATNATNMANATTTDDNGPSVVILKSAHNARPAAQNPAIPNLPSETPRPQAAVGTMTHKTDEMKVRELHHTPALADTLAQKE
ncbi:hypothetical protein BS47DRAFT_1360429 [Hydnum rufescens UP504]|uniref:Uncharacterized protein n=1 Tax=Hydnum rufescens UP504 TaxID=1448309 RepID=A0A9P6DYR1_9AGAM|nr:hypothetical protein BS47DRAFT_1360429 [Hydnum rufescens UP504]